MANTGNSQESQGANGLGPHKEEMEHAGKDNKEPGEHGRKEDQPSNQQLIPATPISKDVKEGGEQKEYKIMEQLLIPATPTDKDVKDIKEPGEQRPKEVQLSLKQSNPAAPTVQDVREGGEEDLHNVKGSCEGYLKDARELGEEDLKEDKLSKQLSLAVPQVQPRILYLPSRLLRRAEHHQVQRQPLATDSKEMIMAWQSELGCRSKFP